MAEWIKWNRGLVEKPQVIRMAHALNLQPWAVAGGLMVLWEWADANTIDGNAPGVTQAFLDSKTCKGFSAAMKKVGWLEEDDDGIKFVNFTEHNSETAKRRALTAMRVRAHRTKCNDTIVTGALPERYQRREEKRREEKKQQQGAASMEAETPGATGDDGGFAAAFFYLHGEVGFSQSDAQKIAHESARLLEDAGWPQRVDQRAREAWRTAHVKDTANVKGFVRTYMTNLTYQPAPEIPRQASPELLAESSPGWQAAKDAERKERITLDEAAQRERAANVELLAQYDRPALANLEAQCRQHLPPFVRKQVPDDATVETNSFLRAAVVCYLQERKPESDGQHRMELGS